MKITNKNKMILPIIIICLGLFLIGEGVYFNLSKEEDTKKKDNPTKHTKQELTVEEQRDVVNNLTMIGMNIYNSGEYLTFEKQDERYYMTQGQLKERGHDISKFVFNCIDTDPIIFFDSNVEEGFPPISITYDCGRANTTE